jgi:tetratricopeptide (TPR) repeat protein
MINNDLINPRFFIAVLIILLLVSCSSPPKIQYQVTTYKQLSETFLQRADTKRQLKEYEQALSLYKQAEGYAQKRNDKTLMGVSQLKRAVIHLQLSQRNEADILISQVEQMSQYEATDLANPLRFIRAKLAYLDGDIKTAIALLIQLEQTFIAIPEKSIYYRMVRWEYQPDSVATSVIEQDMVVLDKLVAEDELRNIEIYSYALYQHAKWLGGQGDSRFDAAINKALAHFSSMALVSKIRDCYQLAADYHRLVGDAEKAAYFQAQVGAP